MAQDIWIQGVYYLTAITLNRKTKRFMKVSLTRASVAMGDDADAPHHFEMMMGDDASLPSIIKAILGSRYLASIAGGKATWTVISRIPVAVVAQQWAEPKMLTPVPTLSSLNFSDNVLSMHFDYRVQQDPDLVFDEFQRIHSGNPYR
ncbi:hypothetical protein [Hymenobacter terricola]|uniref:hypothetical protein n=1 Tax=Hymenobacter terricola TaxID=2819236 RepID=UPI001B30BCB8|nr:hypothetical protein [Hymenobacter terricola]